MSKILIVDDEEAIRDGIQDILEDEGYDRCVAWDSHTAFQVLESEKPDVMVLDIWLEGSELDGIGILKEALKKYPHMPILMISGHGNIETAVSAIQLGAYDFIEKPFKSDKLLVLIKRALETAELRQENRDLKRKVVTDAISDLDGVSSQITHVKQIIERAAPTGSRILISGAPGTGKEVVARMIHRLSKQADGDYVALNCAVLDPDRLEEELFGIEGGKMGVLERANEGTLLLDEVADMPLETQGKIMRVLQEQGFTRIGGQLRIETNVRIIASTSQDLKFKIEKGDFREDLFYRLNVVQIDLPALKDRRDDIPLLAKVILENMATSSAVYSLNDDAVALLQTYDWPGNVRQLHNVIEWVLIMRDGERESLIITADMLPPEITKQDAILPANNDVGMEVMTKPLKEAREIFEKEYLSSQIARFGGNISKTAHFVGMERSALHRKLKSLGIGNTQKPETQKYEQAEG